MTELLDVPAIANYLFRIWAMTVVVMWRSFGVSFAISRSTRATGIERMICANASVHEGFNRIGGGCILFCRCALIVPNAPEKVVCSQPAGPLFRSGYPLAPNTVPMQTAGVDLSRLAALKVRRHRTCRTAAFGHGIRHAIVRVAGAMMPRPSRPTHDAGHIRINVICPGIRTSRSGCVEYFGRRPHTSG